MSDSHFSTLVEQPILNITAFNPSPLNKPIDLPYSSMSSKNTNQQRGSLLKSCHAPPSRPATSSPSASLDPTAGNFNPQALGPCKPQTAASKTDTTALVLHQEPPPDDKVVTVKASQLNELTKFFNDEIITLRKELEMLKQGGWTVSVGPFQSPKQLDLTEVEATRQRLEKSTGLLGALTSNLHSFSLAEATAKQIEAPPISTTVPAVQPAVQDEMKSESITNGTNPVTQAGLLDTNETTPGDGRKSVNATSQTPFECEVAHPDTPLPSTEDPSFTHMSSNWQPRAIRMLAPLPPIHTSAVPPPAKMQTFSFGFLRSFFGGIWWSPGFFYYPVSEGKSFVPSRTYYVLNASTDPYVPCEPGAHGAKLTAFFNPENPEDVDGDEAANAFLDVPCFVTESTWAKRHGIATTAPSSASDNAEEGTRYIYMGMYSQIRYSDRIDYDRLVEHVPHATKMYWAEQLCDITRPAWVTEALMKQLVSKPEYEGFLPGTGAENDVVRKEIGRHMRDLSEWELEAKDAVKKLTKEKVLDAFDAEDAADPPGLRLWWEYLQCVGWDAGFYEVLAREQETWMKKQQSIVAPFG